MREDTRTWLNGFGTALVLVGVLMMLTAVGLSFFYDTNYGSDPVKEQAND